MHKVHKRSSCHHISHFAVFPAKDNTLQVEYMFKDDILILALVSSNSIIVAVSSREYWYLTNISLTNSDLNPYFLNLLYIDSGTYLHDTTGILIIIIMYNCRHAKNELILHYTHYCSRRDINYPLCDY